MKASDKNRQKLSSSETRSPNVKYKSKKWNVNLSAVQDYIQYMSDENLSNSD